MECCAADADTAECIRLASPSSVVLLGGSEESIFSFDHVAGPHTTQEQFFRGNQATPVAHASLTSTWFRHSQRNGRLMSLPPNQGSTSERDNNSVYVAPICSHATEVTFLCVAACSGG